MVEWESARCFASFDLLTDVLVGEYMQRRRGTQWLLLRRCFRRPGRGSGSSGGGGVGGMVLLLVVVPVTVTGSLATGLLMCRWCCWPVVLLLLLLLLCSSDDELVCERAERYSESLYDRERRAHVEGEPVVGDLAEHHEHHRLLGVGVPVPRKGARTHTRTRQAGRRSSQAPTHARTPERTTRHTHRTRHGPRRTE
jgi:hypothetical protein